LNRSLNWKLWTGLLISALFIYLALRNVDMARIWTIIKSARIFFLFIVILLTFLQFIVRAWRWRILLEPIKNTGFLNRLSTTLIGFGANAILPARLGEFIRANYLGHVEKISGSSTFGTIVVERLFDGFTLLLFLLIGLIGTTFPEEWRSISGSLRATGFFLLFAYIILMMILVGFKYKTRLFMDLLDRFLFFIPGHFRPKVMDTIWNFSMGIVLVKNPYKWFQIIFYSLIIWFINLYQIEMIEQALGLGLPFIATFLIMAMASLGVMIPSAPGYIGTFHLSVQYGFLFYGIGHEEGLSAAILWHGVVFFPTLIFGLVAFALIQSSFGRPTGDPGTLKED